MINDKQISNLPAQLSESADNILRAAKSAVPMLRFVKGQYFISEDEIDIGREYVAFPLDWVRGSIRWQNGTVVEERLGRVADGFGPPKREELGYTDKSQWEDGVDPWCTQNMLPMEDRETGDLVAFVSNTNGGRIAIEKLAARVARDLKSGRDRGRPTIALHVGTFTSKDYGKIARPDFHIVGWEQDETPPSPPELNDSIPI
jgi:hypothetical protein